MDQNIQFFWYGAFHNYWRNTDDDENNNYNIYGMKG